MNIVCNIWCCSSWKRFPDNQDLASLELQNWKAECPISGEDLNLVPGRTLLCIPKNIEPSIATGECYRSIKTDQAYTAYDFGALEEWFDHKTTDPLTNRSIDQGVIKVTVKRNGQIREESYDPKKSSSTCLEQSLMWFSGSGSAIFWP